MSTHRKTKLGLPPSARRKPASGAEARNRAKLDRLKRQMTAPTGCKLCGKLAEYRGLWATNRETGRRIGCPEGKSRVVGYAVCARCASRPGFSTRIEDAIIAEIRAELASPACN